MIFLEEKCVNWMARDAKERGVGLSERVFEHCSIWLLHVPQTCTYTCLSLNRVRIQHCWL